ncbi:hypothetical protein EV1_014403 [Malus domestica]
MDPVHHEARVHHQRHSYFNAERDLNQIHHEVLHSQIPLAEEKIVILPVYFEFPQRPTPSSLASQPSEICLKWRGLIRSGGSLVGSCGIGDLRI